MSDADGQLIRAMDDGQQVRVLGVDAAALAEATRRAHGLGPDAARLAAQGVVATALLSAYIKGDERITLHLQGRVPQVAYVGEVDAEGDLRARLTPADLRLPTGGVLDGILIAVKHTARREVYRGSTAIEGRTLEEALADHVARSDQVDVVLRILVEVGEQGAQAASGLLVERLPDAGIDVVERFGALDDAAVRRAATGGGLPGLSLEVLERRPLRWRCRCSQERVEATLVGLGEDDLREMIEQDHGAEVTCHFCNTTWTVPESRLVELRALAGGAR